MRTAVSTPRPGLVGFGGERPRMRAAWVSSGHVSQVQRKGRERLPDPSRLDSREQIGGRVGQRVG